MLMIERTELARRMYEAWRKQIDVLRPMQQESPWACSGHGIPHWPQMNRDFHRPKWEHLDSIEQGVWKNMASDLASTLADAMGAL